MTQHKPAREERRSKELADIKRENNTLRRKAARLQKEVDRLKQNQPEPADFEPIVKPPAIVIPKCSKCGGPDVKSTTLPTGSIWHSCLSCGAVWRSKAL